MKGKRKKEKSPRQRDWHDSHETAFSHDRSKHRKAEAAAPTIKVPPREAHPNAVVISHSGQWAFVLSDNQEYLCLIDQSVDWGESSLLAPGDEVEVDFTTDQPVVRAVGPRRTKLSRLAHIHRNFTEHVLAANIDTMVIVAAAAKPRFKPGLVDRYMVAAGRGGVNAVLVLNKMDLLDEEPEQIAPYRELGLQVISTSCVTGIGIDELRESLHGKFSVLTGHSGVGKSSLLNALDPSLEIHTQEVSSSTEKGKHTTSASRLYVLHDDIRIVDTPGIRNLGLWNVTPQELAFYFPEMEELAMQCRFRDCSHVHEPDCAVRVALEEGQISRLRYESYLRIRESLKTDEY